MNKIRAKKSLGQNFLKSKIIVSKIVEAGKVRVSDTILEIGPGKGILTEELLKRVKKVIAVEKDDRLIPYLKERFSQEITQKKLEIIHDDVFNYKPPKTDYKLIANIPYYITGKIIPHFLESSHQPKLIVIMIQKEVAERIVTKDGKESILSLSVKAYGVPKSVAKVKRELFSPAPRVDSAILLIENINKKFFDGKEKKEKKFFKLINLAFRGKRKKISNSLKSYFGDNQKCAEALQNCGINPDLRPERLTLGQWKCLMEN